MYIIAFQKPARQDTSVERAKDAKTLEEFKWQSDQ